VIRLGLSQVKGLREETPEAVVRRRDGQGPYLSPSDLFLRTAIEKHEAERLVLAGALDVFDRPRGEMLWAIELDFARYARAREEGRSRISLFGVAAALPPPRSIPVPATYPPERLLAMEMETLGLTASAHPCELLEDLAREAGAVPTTELARHVGRSVRVAGFVVTDRRVRVRARSGRGDRPPAPGRTIKLQMMKFLMLEDAHGSVEVTLFPRAYARTGHRLTDAGPYLVTGRVRADHGALTLDGEDVARLAPRETREPPGPRSG
jgi:DNA polymerase III alpha subunit